MFTHHTTADTTTGRPVELRRFADDDGREILAVITGTHDTDVVEIPAAAVAEVLR